MQYLQSSLQPVVAGRGEAVETLEQELPHTSVHIGDTRKKSIDKHVSEFQCVEFLSDKP